MAKPKRVKAGRRRPTKGGKATKPRKPRLSQTPEAKRARAYRRRIRELEAESLRLSELEAQKAEARRERRRERARIRRAELASIEAGEAARAEAEAEAEARRQAGDERQYFADILDYMRNTGSAEWPLSLELTEAEVGARVPWIVVGRFDAVEPPTYAELDRVFRAWEGDIALETRIHPQRLSQIRIVYSDPKAKRGEGTSIVSHLGPWEAIISEISFELDPSDEDSLASRYELTVVPHFYVYFSTALASEAEIDLKEINDRIFGPRKR